MKRTILHLSDIQYGRHHADKDQRPPLYSIDQYDLQLNKIKSDLDILVKERISPGFVVITGDITETSSEEEYQLASVFLDGIAQHLQLDRRRLIMVPGNHDINRDLCKAGRLRAKAYNIPFNPPYFAKFEVYSKFFSSFYEKVEWPEDVPRYEFTSERLFVNYFFPENNLVFIGLNSCIDISEEPPYYGNVSVEQLQKALVEVNQIDKERKMLRIAVMHHNFVRLSHLDDENLKDADELKPLMIQNNVKLLLHGHLHVNKDEIIGHGNDVIQVLGTGSAGLDGDVLPSNCRRYQIMEIDNNIVRVYRRRFDSQHAYLDGYGCWVPDLFPSQTKIYDEFHLLPKKDNLINSRQADLNPEDYDILRIETTEQKLRGNDILFFSYPRKEITIVDRVFDHKNKIYYEYLSVDAELKSRFYFLFVGNHINISATIKHFLENHELPTMGITILTPRIKSKTTGKTEFRANNIMDLFWTISRIKKENYNVVTFFIDDYVWQNCLDISFKKENLLVSEIEHYIDQNLYKYKIENDSIVGEQNEGLCVPFFQKTLSAEFEEDVSNPITVILASGGMGKSALCFKLVNLINSIDKKKAIYISSSNLVDKLDNVNTEVKTIGDLFKLYDSLNGNKYIFLHDSNNLEINISCGNIIVIIDGLDEIESALANKFDLESFLNSLITLNKDFDHCKIIITTRDYHKEKYMNKNDVNLYFLKGFDYGLADKYFDRRFNGDRAMASKAMEYLSLLDLQLDDYYMPLCLSLIADIVERENSDITIPYLKYFSSIYFKPEIVLDNLILRLIDREIDKQKLGITIDQFLELLNEIVVIHKGRISTKSFDEYIGICYPRTSIFQNDKDYCKSFYINPLLFATADTVQLKYDVINKLIKIRYIQHAVENGRFVPHLVPLLADHCYGKGLMFDEIVVATGSVDLEGKISNLINYLIKAYQQSDNYRSQELVSKAISFSLYYCFKVLNPQDKTDRTKLLQSLYRGNLKYVFVYGDFYPLDFCNIQVYESTFIGYTGFLQSVFPAGRTVFYYCVFKDLTLKGNPHIPKDVFDSTCNVPLELKLCFNVDANNMADILQLIKADLKRFLKCFVNSNIFGYSSYKDIIDVFSSKLNKRTFLEELEGEQILMSKKHKGYLLYFIAPTYHSSVLSLINQNNLEPKIEKLCSNMISKYYRIHLPHEKTNQ